MRCLIIVTTFLCTAYGIDWHDCGGKEAAVKFEHIEVTPETIKFEKNHQVAARLVVNRKLPADSTSSITILAKTWIKNFELGCYDGVGSCSEKLSLTFTSICPFLESAGAPCKVEALEPGTYAADNYDLYIPKVTAALKLIVSNFGKFDATWNWQGPNGEQLACLKVTDVKIG